MVFKGWNDEIIDTSLEENLPSKRCSETKSMYDYDEFDDTLNNGIDILIFPPHGRDNVGFCFSRDDLENLINFDIQRKSKYLVNIYTNTPFTEEQTSQIHKFLGIEDPFAIKTNKYYASLSLDGTSLQFAPDNVKNNKFLVLVAVKQNGLALYSASYELKNDKEVVLAAVTQDGMSLEYASFKLQNDKEIVLVAVSQYCYALEYASDELQKDKEIVLAAIEQNGNALQYASDELRNNKEIVLVAVNQVGDALYFASEELRNDREVVLTAIKKSGNEVLQYASDELKNDREFISNGVRDALYKNNFFIKQYI